MSQRCRVFTLKNLVISLYQNHQIQLEEFDLPQVLNQTHLAQSRGSFLPQILERLNCMSFLRFLRHFELRSVLEELCSLKIFRLVTKIQCSEEVGNQSWFQVFTKQVVDLILKVNLYFQTSSLMKKLNRLFQYLQQYLIFQKYHLLMPKQQMTEDLVSSSPQVGPSCRTYPQHQTWASCQVLGLQYQRTLILPCFAP